VPGAGSRDREREQNMGESAQAAQSHGNEMIMAVNYEKYERSAA
jgi:hypothetical protein